MKVKSNEQRVWNRLYQDRDYINSLGFNFFGAFVQGSQNYDLDYEGSDVDTKAMFIPKFDSLILRKNYYFTTHVYENEEHLDLKDIRAFFEIWLKSNINWYEILFTDYFVVDGKYMSVFEDILKHREEIVYYNPYRFIVSVCKDIEAKYNRLFKSTETTKPFVDKLGYNAKELHHILRLKEFIQRYFINKETFAEVLRSKQSDYLISVKNKDNPLYKDLDEVNEIAKEAYSFSSKFLTEVNSKKEEYLNLINDDIVDFLEEKLVEIFEISIKSDWGIK